MKCYSQNGVKTMRSNYSSPLFIGKFGHVPNVQINVFQDVRGCYHARVKFVDTRAVRSGMNENKVTIEDIVLNGNGESKTVKKVMRKMWEWFEYHPVQNPNSHEPKKDMTQTQRPYERALDPIFDTRHSAEVRGTRPAYRPMYSGDHY